MRAGGGTVPDGGGGACRGQSQSSHPVDGVSAGRGDWRAGQGAHASWGSREPDGELSSAGDPVWDGALGWELKVEPRRGRPPTRKPDLRSATSQLTGDAAVLSYRQCSSRPRGRPPRPSPIPLLTRPPSPSRTTACSRRREAS